MRLYIIQVENETSNNIHLFLFINFKKSKQVRNVAQSIECLLCASNPGTGEVEAGGS